MADVTAHREGNASELPLSALSKSSWEEKLRRLKGELAFALERADAKDLAAWAQHTGRVFVEVAFRRVSNLAQSLYRLGKGAFAGIVEAMRAIAAGRGKGHFIAMADRAAVACSELRKSAEVTFGRIADAIKDNPARGAQGILAASLGFLAGSGGPDGDGGLPDRDIDLFGIGGHRSLFTHSILIGVTVEAAVLSLIDLNQRVHSKLPQGHDEFWDKLLANSARIGDAFSRGASSGVAYHLFVDATFQPGAYHGLGVAMPMEAHQAILMTNSLAEGLDAAKREGITHMPQTTAGKLVSEAAEAAIAVSGRVGHTAKRFWEGAVTGYRRARKE